MIKYIFHISDIHIKAGSYLNIKNSFSILVEAIKAQGVDESLLVIVGDIFESKSYLQTDDIFQWKAMCHLLKKANIKTLVMPGNHDYNINSELVRDNVSLLTPKSDYSNITCVNKTCILDGAVVGDPRLEFYIFSPIDKLIPKVLNSGCNSIKIAMLHEPLNAACYDNGETISGARFRASDLMAYDYVLLGDIHLHQYLAPRIAYCGSFVQKTKGEGIEKGYILWNLADGTSKFHPILLKEIFIKITAVNDQCTMPATAIKQVIRHTSLFYKDCSPQYIEDLKKKLVDQYGYINRIVNSTKASSGSDEFSNETPEAQVMPVNKSFNHDQIIKEIMKNDPRLDDILTYHADILRNRNETNYTTYKLNYLYWSNIFCYGEDNYINFNEFNNNLVMLNGKNKDGKSSIIDIMIRVLYNECERGLKEDIVNKSKTRGHIKISFNIGNDEYIVEQIYSRTSKNQFHRLYKNGENITQDTIINTYIYIREKIGLGDYKDFVNMTTAMQNRKFLVDMSQKDFISLLTKITNVDVLKDVEDETKKEINVIKSINKKAHERINSIAEVREDDIKQIEAKRDKLTESRDKLYSDIEAINKTLIDLNKDFNNTKIPNNLDEMIKLSINELKNHKFLTGEKDDKKGDCQIDDCQIDDINLQLGGIIKKLEGIPENIIATIMKTDYKSLENLNKSEISKKIKELRDTTYKPPLGNIRDIATLQSLVETFVPEDLHPIETDDGVKVESLVELNPDDFCKRSAKLFETGLPDYGAIMEDIEELENKIKMFTSNFGSLKFHDDCDSCIHNKHAVRGIFDIRHESSRLQNLKEVIQERPSTEARFVKASAYVENKRRNDIFTRNQIALINNGIITTKLNNYNVALNELKEAKNKLQWDTLQNLERKLNLFKESEIKNLINERCRLMNIKEYLEIKENHDNLLILEKIKISNGSKIININKLNELEIVAKTNLNYANKELTHISEEYRIKRGQFDSRNDLIETFTENTNKLEFLELYYSVINCKTGVPSYVLKQTCKSVENNCNAILQKITDFTIEIIYDKDVKIYTVENDIRISAQLASGMQKFVLDLIFRITLTNISSISSSRTLFVDEGFGALDRDNFIAVAEMLQKLKSNFDSLIIISHIVELRSYVDISINIEKHGYTSFVQFGTLTEDQKTIKLALETTNNSKRIADFKDDKSTTRASKVPALETLNDIKIREYCDNNDGINAVLFKVNDTKIHCNGCNKSFVAKSGFTERHIMAASYIQKHNKYILKLISNDK